MCLRNENLNVFKEWKCECAFRRCMTYFRSQLTSVPLDTLFGIGHEEYSLSGDIQVIIPLL